MKTDLKVVHAELDIEKIKADAFLVAAECANRSLQRHIRVLASTHPFAALERKHDHRLHDTMVNDKMELAHVRQANRLMEGRIAKRKKPLLNRNYIMAKTQVKSIEQGRRRTRLQ